MIPRRTSPNLEVLARDAVAFPRTWAVSSWTRPSVASIHTGLEPRRHGALLWSVGLDADVPTLATRLRSAGFETRAVVTNPFLMGVGFEQGFETFRTLSLQGRWHVPAPEVNHAVFRDGPLPPASLLYVHDLDPHDPYAPHENAASLVRPYRGPANGSMDFVRRELLLGHFAPEPRDVRHVSDLYDAEVRTTDLGLGALFSWLRETGVYDEAWIVVTSDHGEELHDRGSWLHGATLYEEQLNVPLLIKPPASLGIEPGRRRVLASILDVTPTLLDAFGLDPVELDGRSLLPAMRGEPTGAARTLFAIEPFTSGKITGLGRAARRSQVDSGGRALSLPRDAGGRRVLRPGPRPR